MTKARAFAEGIVARAAEIMGATELVPISFAHLDACFYAGEAHVEFARFMLDGGAEFAVPTWTNNGLVSLEQPDLRPEAEDPERVRGARTLMKLYENMGAKPVFTCAPYQLPGRPKLGDHIVAGESNAVTFYNSVIGARTNKYGDYLDVACAILGKAPLAGLHTDEGRKARVLFRVRKISEACRREDVFYHLLGHHIGRTAGERVVAIDGLAKDAGEDRLKALSSACAASGGVELWHGIGVTPEAPELDAVFESGKTLEIGREDLAAARRQLTSARDGPLDMIALGTPHFSVTEFDGLAAALDGRKIKPGLVFYVSTSRFVRGVAGKQIAELERAGIQVVTDVCTYYSPAVRGAKGRVMTNAAKWAYYAPGMLGVEVCFGSLKECAESAVRGEVWRDRALWSGLE
jgi:predicted aconitase